MKNKKIKSICLIASLIVGGFLLSFQLSSIFTAKTIYIWISGICLVVFFLLFFITLVWSAIHLVVSLIKKKPVLYSILPLLVGITVMFLINILPVGILRSAYVYSRDIDGYQDIIDMIESGEWSETGKYWELSTQYSHLSADNEIIVKKGADPEDFCVMFYISKGLMTSIGSSVGHMYCTEGMQPYDYGLADGIWDIEGMPEENWYFVTLY